SAGTVPLRPRPGPPGPWWYSCAPGLPLLQKSPPVGRAGTVPIQHFIVELRPIALVFGKLVLGILPVQHAGHIPVPADLGQDG
ncbi:RNA chaperone Hfq, partial [Dysosmobacter welbionis]